MNILNKALLAISVSIAFTGCMSINSSDKSLKMIDGPPISDIRTPFDEALSCLSGKISPKITFSVGAISDATGKEQFTEGGTGKFITQGAGEIVQSALFNAGVNILNRRDPRVLEAEIKWGIRTNTKIIPSRYFITGSINSLDFIPGAGFEAQIDGIGPRYRQHRILVGLDLSVTDSSTGRIVANSSIQKQIFADELGVGVGRFFGNILVTLDAANLRREAISLAMRQMLNLATYDLLTQLMRTENYVSCSEGIKTYHNVSLSKAWRSELANTENGNDNTKKDKSGHIKKEPAVNVEEDNDHSDGEHKDVKPFMGSPPDSKRDDVESLIKNFDVR